MKKTILTIAMAIGSIFTGICDTHPNIIPAPQKMVAGEGTFVAKKGLTIVAADAKDFSAHYLQDKLEEVLGYNIVDCNNMIVIAFILAVYKYYHEA